MYHLSTMWPCKPQWVQRRQSRLGLGVKLTAEDETEEGKTSLLETKESEEEEILRWIAHYRSSWTTRAKTLVMWGRWSIIRI